MTTWLIVGGAVVVLLALFTLWMALILAGRTDDAIERDLSERS